MNWVSHHRPPIWFILVKSSSNLPSFEHNHTLLSIGVEIFVAGVSIFIDNFRTHLATGVYCRQNGTGVAIITRQALQTLYGTLGFLENETCPTLQPIISPPWSLCFMLQSQWSLRSFLNTTLLPHFLACAVPSSWHVPFLLYDDGILYFYLYSP